MITRWPPVSLITGTDTGVGKTITAAALAAVLLAEGRSVAGYKPVQAGDLDEEPDAVRAARLSGATWRQGIGLRDPMAPLAAAEREGRSLPTLQDHRDRITELRRSHRHLVIEGAGGVLVELDHAGTTIADLARSIGPAAGVIVVCRSGLGTLNHTALTLEALRHRGATVAGLVIGSWPPTPTPIDLDNRDRLARLGAPLLGCIRSGAGRLTPARFRTAASEWFRP
ncbi:dethiobiotin synthase [Microlunatus speluncae]|uniref:dethiobiotin synthase n=1 Tax=Microlunatus speluncae TaxID=2594267 RepID=UPI0012666119|nr:dethiobiotin synthase [Microlunatus speluncae]